MVVSSVAPTQLEGYKLHGSLSCRFLSPLCIRGYSEVDLSKISPDYLLALSGELSLGSFSSTVCAV